MDGENVGKVKIVVGLGNPGRKYARTRHNVGFRVVETLAARFSAPAGRKAFGGLLVDSRLPRPDQGEAPPQRVMLFEPHTYMNRSGQAVKGLVAYHQVPCRDVLVVLDDLALPPGRIRLRAGGSAGGHKGLADVLSLLATTEVPRLRIGIGPAPPLVDGADFVLSRFDESERETIQQVITWAAQAVEDWLFNPLDHVMSKHNSLSLERKTEDE